MTATAPDLWWERLRNRDASEAGSFVYGVVTTGIYCRPGCPSRLPRKENIRFFTSGEEAKRAGFRPCLRCRPDGASLEDRQAEAISKACALIEAAEEKPDFDAVAKAVEHEPPSFPSGFQANDRRDARSLLQCAPQGSGDRGTEPRENRHRRDLWRGL